MSPKSVPSASVPLTYELYVKKLVAHYGIKTGTDDARVYHAIDQFVHRVVKNVIENLRIVLEVSKQKLVTPKHFHVLLELSHMSLAFPGKEIAAHMRSQKGGDPVLPSEYFGRNSGRYSTSVPPFQTSAAELTEGIARAGMMDTFGSVLMEGGSTPGTIPKKVVDDMLKDLKVEFRLSKEAKLLLNETLRQNVEHFLTDLKKASTFQKAGIASMATVKKVLHYHKYKFL